MDTILSDSSLQELFLQTLTDKEKHAYTIAQNHLGCSFSLAKANGYVKWKKQYLEKLEKQKLEKLETNIIKIKNS